MQKTTQSIQSIVENREFINKQSTIDKSIVDNKEQFSKTTLDTRVKGLHTHLTRVLDDGNYGIGHTYKIARKLSDYDIVSLADYCSRKARKPAAAFISLCDRKISHAK